MGASAARSLRLTSKASASSQKSGDGFGDRNPTAVSSAGAGGPGDHGWGESSRGELEPSSKADPKQQQASLLGWVALCQLFWLSKLELKDHKIDLRDPGTIKTQRQALQLLGQGSHWLH